MIPIKLALRNLFRKGEHTTTRIISLALGIAFGVILLSEVFYYYSYDRFYPDASRLYVVEENFNADVNSDQLKTHDRVSGAIAPGMKAEVPGVEEATRFTSIGESDFYTDDKKAYHGDFVIGDDKMFKVIPRPVISGNPEQILKTPMNCMISDKLAKQIGGDPVGKVIELKVFPGKKVTITGVFKAMPENSIYSHNAIISMPSVAEFIWDGSQNWLGNDRYFAVVKLQKGVDTKTLEKAVRQMQIKHQEIEKLEQESGLVLKYSFIPLTKVFSEGAKDMIVILSVIAFAVIFVSLLNYILLTLTTLVNKAKSSAIYKTYGAEAKNLRQMIFSETFLVFLLSLIMAFFVIMLVKPFIEEQVAHKLSSTLNLTVIAPITIVLLLILAAITYFPSQFFSRIPVATAFRQYRQKGSKWKLWLLAFQFIGISFIFTILIVVTLQYNKLMGGDHGYNSEDVLYTSTSGIANTRIQSVLNQLREVPEIEKVGLGIQMPTESPSGNNIFSSDGKKELFNVSDFYYIDENYFSILNIPVNQGEAFSASTAPGSMLVSKKCSDMLVFNNGWKDGVVGKDILISEHTDKEGATIMGVFPDFVVKSMADPDTRPIVFFYLPEQKFLSIRENSPSFNFMLITKVHKGREPEANKKIASIINNATGREDAKVLNLAQQQEHNYMPQRGFKRTLWVANGIIIILTVIGLIGYTTSEIARRRKDMAIRRINGATLWNILKMMLFDMERIAIPAVIIGLLSAWFIAIKWMENFAYKISLHWSIFVLSGLLIIICIAAIVTYNYFKYANRNPVEALRYE